MRTFVCKFCHQKWYSAAKLEDQIAGNKCDLCGSKDTLEEITDEKENQND